MVCEQKKITPEIQNGAVNKTRTRSVAHRSSYSGSEWSLRQAGSTVRLRTPGIAKVFVQVKVARCLCGTCQVGELSTKANAQPIKKNRPGSVRGCGKALRSNTLAPKCAPSPASPSENYLFSHSNRHDDKGRRCGALGLAFLLLACRRRRMRESF